MIKHFQQYCILLLFGLLAVFLVHNFDSIGQDIGRHLRTGEIIWQTGSVPTTNLFSFTEPDFSFVNHHWLSEVIFYGVHNLGGFTALIWLKIVVVLSLFYLLFLTIKPLWINDIASRLSTGGKSGFWAVVVAFLLSIFIFISRTEARPEIFSFLILAFYLFALFKAKYEQKYNYLLFLPLAQLLWVNLHIYFFIGPLIFLFYLIDKKINHKSQITNHKQTQNSNDQNFKTLEFRNWNLFGSWNLVLGTFMLVVLANLANPNFIAGALYPFNVLKEYGYSIAENQTLFFLADFFGFNLPIFVFKVSVGVFAVLVLLNIKKFKERFFEAAMMVFFIYAGFRMLRNLPLYALASFPVMAIFLSDITRMTRINIRIPRIVNNVLKAVVVVFLTFIIFWVANDGYYKWARLSKEFGFSVPDGLKEATDFVKDNKIDGSMFNNFDIGGYLIWQLPHEKVFVDNRPEAYSAEFFEEIYKPMQENPEKWEEFSEKYGINFIFFGHTDGTPWGKAFLQNIVRDPNWKVVFINENAIILVKNIAKNEPIFSKYRYELTE